VQPVHVPRTSLNPLKPTVAIWVWASECPDVKNYKWRLNPVWHRMLYSCTHMATVGFKGLMKSVQTLQLIVLHSAQTTLESVKKLLCLSGWWKSMAGWSK